MEVNFVLFSFCESMIYKVVFDQPVTVSGSTSNMRLALNVHNEFIANSTSFNYDTNITKNSSLANATVVKYAVYDPVCSMRAEGFSYEDSSVCFTYTIEHGDIASPFLTYANPWALELNGGSIFRTATTLVGHAVVLLPEHGKGERGGIEALQKVSALSVTLSGLSHDDASDLQVGFTSSV
jgi:hypothetical protein